MKRKSIFTLILITLLLASCSKSTTSDRLEKATQSITHCAKLYTTQYNVHKILTYKDLSAIEGSLFAEKISIPIPGDRKLVIPVDATIKSYIDFSQFGKENIHIDGEKLTITLPDPKIIMTSSKVDYKNEKQYLSWNRSRFTPEEKEDLLKQGKASILLSLQKSDILTRTKENAAKTLVPILLSCGFQANNITFVFSDEIERNKHSEKTIKQLITDLP